MACSKYTLTNTGSSIVNFSYQRCDDAMWEYQVELNQGQTKTIWLLDSTYSTAFSNSIVEVDLGVFPPVALSPTPTISVTPSNTPTISVTPSNTPTHTQTPTVTQTQTGTPSVTTTQTQTPTTTTTQTQTGTPSVTTTTTQTQTGTPNSTPTPSVTTTNTQTPTNTPTPSITASQTPTVTTTNTQTPTVTTTNTQTPTQTQSGTPAVTPTPTPSSFGANTFKVHFYSGSTGVTLNDLILTEIPYVGTSGVGFTGTTGSYPLAWSGGTNYGTHSGLSGVTVSFEITSTGGGGTSVTINYYKNNSFIQSQSQGCYAGSNTLSFSISGGFNASPSDTVEFYIS